MKWLIPIALLVLCASSAMATIDTIECVVSAHDASVYNCGGFSLTQSVPELGWYSGCAYSILALFPSVTIPQSSTINSATLQGWFVNGSGTPDYNVIGEDTGSAAVFSDLTNFSQRHFTTAYTVVTDLAINPKNRYRSLGTVTSIIQEIVNRTGDGPWVSGNNMALFLIGQNDGDELIEIRAVDGGSGNYMLLIVDYTAPAGGDTGPPIPTESPLGARHEQSQREGP